MRYLIYASILLAMVFSACQHKEIKEIDLSGNWYFKLDPDSVGEDKNWATSQFKNTIKLPGTLDDADIGAPIDHQPKMDISTLTGLHRKHTYTGPVWYQRQVEIPDNWSNKYIELELERVIWQSTVWVDGKKVDSRESLVAPHCYDLSRALTPGTHTLTIRIDNNNKYPGINVTSDTYPDERMKEMAHAYTNHTQIKWNGILGNIRLQSTGLPRLKNIQVFPDAKKSTITVKGTPVRSDDHKEKLQYSLTNPAGDNIAENVELELASIMHDGHFEFTLPVENPQLWDEFNPQLYTLSVSLSNGKNVTDTKTIRFGFSEISNEGETLKLNGERIFMRGNLECSIFPLTGYPPTSKEAWAELISKAKSYGLNHLRFHSYCPPKAAFEAADEAGFYLQTELPVWNMHVGENQTVNNFLKNEAGRILEEYGNHPSFVMMSLGNELSGDSTWMITMVSDLKQMDDRHLYTATTFSFQEGFGARPRSSDDFFVTQWTENGWVRGQKIFNDQSPEFNKDYTLNIKNIDVPLISHEIGQYSVFPDFNEIEKYSGNLEPLNFKAIRNDMKEKGLLVLSDQYLKATGKFATLLYKEEIERALKTPGFDGFQLLQLQDFPGQGTALVGLLNAFWESKGVISGEAFREFCSEVVPLARFEKATYQNSENFNAGFEIANFYKELTNQRLTIKLIENNNIIAAKSFDIKKLPIGNGKQIGTFTYDLSNISKAKKIVLEASLDGTPYKNHWNIWVYPDSPDINTEEIVFTKSFDEAEQALNNGKKVLLNPDLEFISGVDGKFLPVFWSPVHFPNQPGTMGILVDTTHQAFAHFPTSYHSDWQWWDLSVNARTIQFDSLNVSPIVRMIDNFYKNRNMATVFETKVGNGKLIFSGIDLSKKLDSRPAALQFKYSLIEYMNSDDFNPEKASDFKKLRKELLLVDKQVKKKYNIYE